MAIHFRFHPQMTFRHEEGESMGRISRPDRPGPPPKVEDLPRKTMDDLLAMHAVVAKMRLEDGIKANNQVLDAVGDPTVEERAKYGQDRIAKGRANRIAHAGATKVAKAAPCEPINTLASLEALAAGVHGRKHLCMDRRGHVTGIQGDLRMGPVVEYDAWTIIPQVRIPSLQDLADRKLVAVIDLDPVEVRRILASAPDPDPDKVAEVERELWRGLPPELRDEGIINHSIHSMRTRGKPAYWNRVYGPGDPRTLYRARGDAFSHVFDRLPVQYWEENIEAPQARIDGKHPGRMRAAGYLPEGSDGR